jgi:hypothetical protein
VVEAVDFFLLEVTVLRAQLGLKLEEQADLVAAVEVQVLMEALEEKVAVELYYFIGKIS